jgi:hypothetical protein
LVGIALLVGKFHCLHAENGIPAQAFNPLSSQDGEVTFDY